MTRPRFSLRTLVLFVCLAGSGFGLWWRWEPWVPLTKFGPAIGHLKRASISQDGKKAIAVFWDNAIHGWDIQNEKALCSFTGHTKPVNSAHLSPDGKQFVTTSGNNNAQIWKTQNGRKTIILKGHQATVNSAIFSPEGEKVVTASSDGTAGIWDSQVGHFDSFQLAER